MDKGDLEKELRQKVLAAAVEHYKVKHQKKAEFQPGDKIPYGGRVFDGQ